MQKKYTLIDLIIIPLKCAPLCMLGTLAVRLVTALLPGLEAALIARFIDKAVMLVQGEVTKADVLWPLVLVLAAVSWGYMSASIQTLLSTKVGMKLNEHFQAGIIEKKARLSYRHLENNEDMELINRVSADPAGKFQHSADNTLDLIRDILSVVSVLTVIASQVWWAALAVIGFSIPLGFLAVKAGRKRYAEDKRAQRYTRRADYLHGILTDRESVEERTLFGYTQGLEKRWAQRYDAACDIEVRTERRKMIQIKGTGMISLLIAALIAGTLIWPLAQGTLSVGLFISLTTVSFSLVQQLSWSLPYAGSELARNREYCKDLTAFSALSEQEGALDIPSLPLNFQLSQIEFRDIRFAYPGTDRYILNGFSATLTVGRHYAVVGANGAGKTTLTKLLTGLYPDYEGEILINGQELRTYPLSALKAIFKSANQDFARYAVTARENILLGDLRQGANPDAESSIAALEMQDTIHALPQGIDTPLGKIRKDSVDLSGGEWQRLALARVFGAQAQMRILDEPTAALDPVAESSIYELFGRISHGMTTLFITHRLGAARLADEILVLDGGRVVESGSHDALMKKGGLYSEMFESQRSWFE